MNINNLDAYCGKKLASGRFKVLNVLVYDYSWQICDHQDEEKHKLLFKIKFLKHLNLLLRTSQITNEFIWKWFLFKEDDFFFAVEDFDYYQIGESLKSQIKLHKSKSININETLISKWIKQLLVAVDCLHSYLIVHHKIDTFVRLLNGNIILNVDWNSSLVESLDESKIDSVTIHDITYNCPEFNEFNLIDSKYDIWCIGWCLFELCTLNDPKSVLSNTYSNWPQMNLPFNVSDRLNDLFIQMTHLNPDMRPTANEILSNQEWFNTNEFKFGDCVLRRFKIGELIEPNVSWNIIDLNESNKVKTMHLCAKNKEFKKPFLDLILFNTNLVEVMFFELNERIYFISPLKQLTLYRILKDLYDNKFYSVEIQILKWFKDILKAVSYLHDNLILHAWLNPREILFENDTLKVCLTAQSIALNSVDSRVNLNDPLDLFYNCPEYMKNEKISLKYDIWSCGWILYHMCTLDYDIITKLELNKDFTHFDFQIPTTYSVQIRDLFQKMIDLQPELRPTSRQILKNEIFEQIIQYESKISEF